MIRPGPPEPIRPSTSTWIVPSTAPPSTRTANIPAQAVQVRSDTPTSARSTKRTSEAGEPVPSRLVIRRWVDPLLDGCGYPATGFYVERYWGPVVGPSSLLLIRALVRRLEIDPEGFGVDTADLAAMIGCSSAAGVSSQFWKTARRAQRFGLLRRVDERLYVRSEVGPLSRRLGQRLPRPLREEIRLWDTSGICGAAAVTPPLRKAGNPDVAGETSSLGVLRMAARGLCTADELRTLDRRRRLP